ncbi:MAG: phosphate ABC transporter ATP-binding protein, partial [bacterium]
MSAIFTLRDVSLAYKTTEILNNANLTFMKDRVTCIIGPSGSGKTTLLRTLNRMNDGVPGFRCRGTVLFKDRPIYSNGLDVHRLRQKVGMVFQKPCVFPKSICDNVLFGVKHLNLKKKKDCPPLVEEKLRAVFLWKEVKDKLHRPATELSQGQQQRLVIARALAVEPSVLLMDEPTSSLDHQAAGAIEELVKKLSHQLTIIMVTHNLAQAQRIADDVVFMCEGRICESGEASLFFKDPQKIETKCYV